MDVVGPERVNNNVNYNNNYILQYYFFLIKEFAV